ncbi:MAG: hypothetical protein AB1523_08780, partial [Bacillota bacterium]
MPVGKEKGPLSGGEQRATLSEKPEPRKDGGLDGAELARFEQLSFFGEEEPAAPAEPAVPEAGTVSSDIREVTVVETGCARPPGAVRSASAGAPGESLGAEEAQAGARRQKKMIRQKLSEEKRKKSRERFLRLAEAINVLLEEHMQRSGKTAEEILFEILGSAAPAPSPGRRPGKRSRRKNAGPTQAAAAPPRERDAVLQKGGASPQKAGLRETKSAAERKRMVAGLKRRPAENLAKELEKKPEKRPEKAPGKKPEEALKKKPEEAPESGLESGPASVPQGVPEKLPKSASSARESLRSQGEGREERPPVKVTFFPAEDAAVLSLAESGAASPAADLYLHRQALGLLLSPGFETLLSVQAARDIQLLDYQLATVRHVLKHLRGRALLCDEVGLGKTIEAGLIMMEYLL